jgi:hypothetical protein
MTQKNAKRLKELWKCLKVCISAKNFECYKANMFHKGGNTGPARDIKPLEFPVLLMPNGNGQFMLR